jgi:hypothetical protein
LADAFTVNDGEVSVLVRDGGRRRHARLYDGDAAAGIDTGLSAGRGAEVTEFMHALQRVLPCKYCRDSLHGFLQDLEPPHVALSVGRLDDWMYRLHNMVNEKLWRQQYTAAGVPDTLHDALVKTQTVPLEIIRKRARIAGHRVFSILDIELLLGIIAQNCVTHQNRVDFGTFVARFARLLAATKLALYGVDTRLAGAAGHIAACPDAETVLHLIQTITSPDVVCDYPVTKARFDEARASACKAGVCK